MAKPASLTEGGESSVTRTGFPGQGSGLGGNSMVDISAHINRPPAVGASG